MDRISTSPEPRAVWRDLWERITSLVTRLEAFVPTVPVIVDDVKRYPDFHMTRLTYFSIECDEPAPGWTLELDRARVPFLMMGLSGIVLRPTGARARFDEPDAFRDLFDLVEQHEALYVDVNDVWLPNGCFEGMRVGRGDVFRVGVRLFARALAYRSNRETTERFEAEAIDLRGEIEPSPAEADAFRAWSRSQIDDARRVYHEDEDAALPWEPDERFPEREETR
jgi:hypothetical protein